MIGTGRRVGFVMVVKVGRMVVSQIGGHKEPQNPAVREMERYMC